MYNVALIIKELKSTKVHYFVSCIYNQIYGIDTDISVCAGHLNFQNGFTMEGPAILSPPLPCGEEEDEGNVCISVGLSRLHVSSISSKVLRSMATFPQKP